jgi:LPXTG-motif cell wall-anchored protein
MNTHRRGLRLVAVLLALLAFGFGPVAGVAFADHEVDINDFIDDQGNFDEEGYFAALADHGDEGDEGTADGGVDAIDTSAGSGSGSSSGSLPLTGSDTGMLVGVAAAALVLGGGAVLGARNARRRTAA